MRKGSILAVNGQQIKHARGSVQYAEAV